MSKTVCSPVSFSGKSGCDSGMRGKLNSFPSLQLPGEVHFRVEQNLHIKQCAWEPSASCAEFRLAGDTPAQAGIQPRCEQPQGSLFLPTSSLGEAALPGPGKPLTTRLRDRKETTGKGRLHLASGQGTRTSPSFRAFRDQTFSPPRRAVRHKDQVQGLLLKQNLRKPATSFSASKVSFERATLDGTQGSNSRRALFL